MDFKTLLYNFAGRVDALPFMPHQLATRVIDKDYETRRSIASRNKRWAEIENLRQNADGTKTLLSDKLGWPDFDEQQRIAHELHPKTWGVKASYRVQEWTTIAGVSKLFRVVERFRHGWSYEDVHNFDIYLTTTVSKMLNTFADELSGWPATNEYPTFEDWEQAIRAAAHKLDRYNNNPELEEAETVLTSLLKHRSSTAEQINAATQEQLKQDKTRINDAKDALVWVADNLPHLWV